MARKIPLLNAEIKPDGFDHSVSFSYGQSMTHILEFGRPGEGLLAEELLRCVEAKKPLKKAIAEGADCVTFSEEQWKTLKDKLDKYPFGVADDVIAEFILTIRNAVEIT